MPLSSGAYSVGHDKGGSYTDGDTHGEGYGSMDFDASLVVPTAEENRPVNMAVRYLIRARP